MRSRAPYRRNLHRLLGTALGLLFAVHTLAAELLLVDWLRQLRGEGVHVLYRHDLFDARTRVVTQDRSLRGLARVLPGHGLELAQHGSVWTIRRAPDAPHAATPGVDASPVIDSMIVTGTRYRFPGRGPDPAAVIISADEMQGIPALAGDSLRAVTRLPGVSGIGISARPHFRGGLQDEVLVSIDGVALLDPSHLSDFHSLISAIDDRAVASMDVYTGAFPARYGNRLSGVMEMSTQRAPGEFDSELEASLYALRAQTRGRHGGPWMSDWLLSARAGDLSRITQEFNARSGKPEFQDLFGRIDLAPREDAQLRLASFYSRDDAQLREDEEHAASRVERLYLWAQWQQAISDALSGRLTASWTDSDHDKRELNIADIEPDPAQPLGSLDFGQDLQRFALLGEFGAAYGSTQLEFGAEVAWAEVDYAQTRDFRRGLLGKVLGTGRRVHDVYAARAAGWYGGAYLAAEVPVGELLRVQPGIRWDVQDYYFGEADSQWSPRLGLRYELAESLALRLSLGRYRQPEGIHELQLLDGEKHFFEVQSADQIAMGAEWSRAALQLRAELWSKRYRNPKTRYENLYNTFVLLPYTEPDRVPVAPTRARAEGIDGELRYEFASSLTGTLRLGYLEAEDRVNDTWIPRRWSQRYSVGGLLNWSHREWKLSAAVTWHSGWHSSGMPASIDAGTTLPIESVLNNRTLRDYLAVDLGASRSWRLPASQLTLIGGLTNAMGRNNIAGLDYDIEVEDGAILFAQNPDHALPLIPMLGVRLAF